MRKSIHLIHAAGLGMSALAHILLDYNWRVFGWDDALYPRLRVLMSRGLVFCDPSSSPEVEYVVYSRMTNPDTLALYAAKSTSSILGLYEFVSMLAQQTTRSQSVIVSGSVGKSSTTWLLAEMLQAQGLNPTVLTGAERFRDGRTGVGGDGEILLLEVPEDELSFTLFFPTVSIITAIDGGENRLESYRELVANTASSIYVPRGLADRLSSPNSMIIEVRTDEELGLRNADSQAQSNSQTTCKISVAKLSSRTSHSAFSVQQNVLLAFAAAKGLGVSDEAARSAITRFRNPRHRLECLPMAPGLITLMSDVAHRPRSVQMALSVARGLASGTLLVFYEPSTAGELQEGSLLADALESADFIGLLDAKNAVAPGCGSAVVPVECAKSTRQKWFRAGSLRAGSLSIPFLEFRFPCIILCLGMYVDSDLVAAVRRLVEASSREQLEALGKAPLGW